MTLDEWLYDRERSHRWLAARARINPSQISRIRNGKQWPTREVAAKLLEVCPGLSWDEWLVEHGDD